MWGKPIGCAYNKHEEGEHLLILEKSLAGSQLFQNNCVNIIQYF